MGLFIINGLKNNFYPDFASGKVGIIALASLNRGVKQQYAFEAIVDLVAS